LGAHVGLEALAVLLLGLAELLLGEEHPLLQRGVARVDDDVVLEVDDPLQAGCAHVQQGAEAAGHGLEEPDVDDRGGQLDGAHPLAAHPRVRHLDAAAVADHPLVLHAAVLAAGALPVLLRAEDPLAEQAVLLGPISPVIDRLGLFDLAERPAPDVVGAGQPDLDGPVVIDTIVGTFAHAHETLSSARPWSCRSRGWLVGESDGLPIPIDSGRPPGVSAHVTSARHYVTLRGPIADRPRVSSSEGDE